MRTQTEGRIRAKSGTKVTKSLERPVACERDGRNDMGSKKQIIKIDGRDLTISNVEKVFYPESGFTKGDVIAFYSEIADVILPHLYRRPLTLKRYPEGVHGEHFYEKNAPKYRPSWVETFPVARSEGGGDINYVLCNDRATLVWVTNLGDIEKHVLLAPTPDLNRPRSIVFDLDPGEPAGLVECGEVALHLQRLFKTWGLDSFAKVSGSKGLHLSVPLNGEAPYEATQPFAKAVAELVSRQFPKGVVSDMAKRLRTGKVLIDWSQNSDFKTTVSVYSLRAKGPDPLVSLPVTWEELARAVRSKNIKGLVFTAQAAIKRISKVGDLFAPVLQLQQELPVAFTKALDAGPPQKLSRWPRNTKRGSSGPKDKSIREYTAKRDLSRTPEPGIGKVGTEKDEGPFRYVIQKHAASHLHYDWRLEMQGVLRSWAVPKGPPTKLQETRLAMHVEDHPLEYADFEGTIPKGNYGAGTVMVWDQGEYDDLTGNPASAFRRGKLHVVMRGKKLKGEWIMVKDRREPDSNKWLLIKAGKALKLSAKADDTSAISGRTMKQIALDNDAQWRSTTPAEKHRLNPPSSHRIVKPTFVEPMQCKPISTLPEDGSWTFEIKFDGYRCIAIKSGSAVELVSRNNKKLNGRFPELVAAFGELQGDFAVDGEIVALDPKGRPAFQLLQNSESKPVPIFFYGFDLLHHDGETTTQHPIEKRREGLENLFAEVRDPLRLSPLLEGDTNAILAAVQKLGLEGVVGKRQGSVYEAGERSGAWIKHRTNQEQEFVIGGYVPGARGFDTLIVGVYEKKRLLYAAKVKDGFVPRIRGEIFPLLKKLQIEECPFANLPEKKASRWGEALTAAKMKECRWVRPTLVCQVGFVEWTDSGKLRHCRFIAMRDDKIPTKVVRES